MTKLTNLFLGCAIMAAAMTVNAQSSAKPPESPTPGEQVPAKRTFKHDETIEDKYDRFKDYTSVSLNMQLTGVKFNGLQVLINDGDNGEKPNRKPPTGSIALTFLYAGEDTPHKLFHSLIFLADGERIRIGEAAYLDLPVNYRHIETMIFGLPHETLRKLTVAKKVEFQLGQTELAFTDGQLEALRDFYSRLHP